MDLEPLKIDRSQRRRRGRRRRFVGPLVLLAAVLVAAWFFRRPLMDAADRLRLPEVETTRAVSRRPAQVAGLTGASANGYVVAKTRAALSADTPGRIVAMNVEEGSVVREGDVVARLFSDEHEAALRRAEADLERARAGLERVRAEARTVESSLAVARSSRDAATSEVERAKALLDLAQKSYDRTVELQKESIESRQRLDERASELAAARAAVSVAEARLQAAERQVAQTEAQVEAARAGVVETEASLGVLVAVRDQAAATLDKTYVRAPFDGIVVLKDAEVGEVVSPNVQGGSNARGSVVTMVDFSSLEVQAEVPETSLAAVKVGARAQVFLDAFPDTAYAGRVSRIWPTANRTKATVEVRVSLETIDERMRPEMGVRVVFLDGSAGAADHPEAEALQDVDPVVVVERGAVVRVDGRDGVFLLERDVARFRPVATGEESGGRIVIAEGLAGGEELVRDPPATLRDGDRIVREEEQ